ncbi:MAG: hypothetical protein IT371_11350 [Deltaproteobacteria bacterium]|nr:hypothetical protein [Deltaproteobacteria bacterium]
MSPGDPREEQVGRPPTRSGRGAGWWLALALLLAATGLLFARVSGFRFLKWDDPIYVTDRAEVRAVAAGEAGAWRALLSPRRALEGRFWEYFPLRDLSYAMDAAAAGPELPAAPFHRTNLLLHLATVALLALLGRLLGLSPLAAVGSAAFFGVHPLTVEPVAWVTGRKDLLCALFVLAALAALAAYHRRPGRRGTLWLGVSLLAALAALASKGPGVIVAVLCPWLAFSLRPRLFRDRRVAGALLLIALASAAALTFAVVVGRRSGVIGLHDLGLGERLLRAAGSPLHAVSQIVGPIELSPVYTLWPASALLDPFTWGSVLLGGLGVALAVRFRIRPPLALPLGLLGCFLLALLPTSGILPVSQLRADRFLYLPLAFAALLGGCGVSWLVRRVRAVALAPILLLPLFAFGTHRYLETWRDDVALWRGVLAHDADHPVANGALGALALEQGELELADRLLRRSLARAPNLPTTWVNHGRLLRLRASPGGPRVGGGDPGALLREAGAAQRRALALDPRHASAEHELGLLALERGDASSALTHLQRCLSLPRCPRTAADLATRARRDARGTPP